MVLGFLDHASRHHIAGWALDEARPDVPLHVTISDHGRPLMRVLANRHRADVEAERGIAICGFDLHLPGLSPLTRHVISARVDGQDHDLMNSPFVIEPAQAFDAETERALACIVASADGPTLDRAALVLADTVEAILAARASLHSHEALRHFRYRWAKHKGPGGDVRLDDPPPRALVITAKPPEFDGSRDGIMPVHHALSLRRLGYDVAVLPADLARPEGHLARILEQAGVRFHHGPFTASVEEMLRREGATFDVVLLVGGMMMQRYAALVRAYCSRATLVFGRIDDDEQALPMPRTKGFIVPPVDPWAAEALAADATITADAAQARRLSPSDQAPLDVVAWAVPVRPTLVPFDTRRGVAFLGANAAKGDLRPLARLILSAVATLDAEIEEVAAPEPTIPSLATDIALFDRIRLGVVLGATPADRQRVLECFAAGVPCIAPRQLLSELGASPELGACDTADLRQVARRIVDLHDDHGLNNEMRKRGLDLVDFQHQSTEVDAAMARVVGQRRRKLALRKPVSVEVAQHAAHGLVDAFV